MGRVVIAGAGIVGLLCAYELRRRGASVTVLEREGAGGGCSWANSGWIVPSFSTPLPAPGLIRTALRWMLRPDSPLYISPRMDLERVRWLWSFARRCNDADYERGLRALAEANRSTIERFDSLRGDGVEFELHRSRPLFLFRTPGALEAVAQDLERLTAHGYAPSVRLGRGEVRDLVPAAPDVVGGVLAPEERHLRPETLASGLAIRLRAMGVEVREGVEVTGMRRDRGAVRALRTSEGEVAGDQFLLTPGAWSGRLGYLLGIRLPVQAGKGYTITITDAEMHLPGPVYLDEARVALTPFAGALRVGGTMELAGADLRVSRRRVDAIRDAFQSYLGRWPAGRGEAVWAGLRPLTPDGLPLLGRIPAYDNLYVATGHGMYGVTLAPASASAVAALMMDGAPSFDLTPFRPDRFGPVAREPEARSPE